MIAGRDLLTKRAAKVTRELYPPITRIADTIIDALLRLSEELLSSYRHNHEVWLLWSRAA
jgi:hypothetical protein